MNTIIERLDIRVRGISPDDGARLAQRVGELLGDAFASQGTRQDIGAIVARIEAAPHESIDELSRRVVDVIIRQV